MTGRGFRHRHWRDLAGVSSVFAMALAYLSPAVKDGWYFGPYDAGSNGTIGHPGGLANLPTYNRINGDLINQGIPWNALDWRLIHAGHLPLWNPYNMLGLPQLFNFESSAFSLPDLVSYAVPLRMAWIVIALVKLVVAGTGAYVLVRQLDSRPLAASFGGIAFMLSGGFASWLGWSLSGVVAWAPWVCALILLAYRDRRRRFVVLLAVSVAFAFFGGFPEMYALLGLALLVFAVLGGLALLLSRRGVSIAGSLRAAGGLVAGTLLAAPLLWPGAQLLRLSTHAAGSGHDSGTPVSRLSLFVSAGYYGLPTRGSTTFPGINFYETVSYVGILAIALALAGLFLARRQAAVVAVAGLTVACLLATYRFGSFNLGGELLKWLPVSGVHPSRARLLAGLGISVLGAVGLDRILRRPARSARLAWLAASLAGAGLVAAMAVSSATQHLPRSEWTERLDSLLWPGGLALAGVLSAVALVVAGRRDRPLAARWRAPIGLGLAGAQAAFLLFAGIGLNSWSTTGFKQYRGAAELHRIVGRGLVGLDGARPGSPKIWPRLGFYPNLNIVYRVAEFAAHDPILPAAYARAFPVPPAGGHGRTRLSALNMPDIASASVAREYGIAYLLVQPGRPVPAGTTLVATISGERLVRVEGGVRFSFVPSAGGAAPRVRSWSQTDDNQWSVRVSVPPAPASSRVLVLRISRVPGFSVTDGSRSLSVRAHGRFEMSVTVPPGVSTVEIRYWPGAFTDGLLTAGLAALALALWCAASMIGSRGRARNAKHRRGRSPAAASA